MGREAAVRLMVVGEHAGIGRGLRMWLALEPGFAVVGDSECTDLPRLLATTRPDVVLVDLEGPGLVGRRAAECLHLLAPELPVVVLSLHDDLATREWARASGAAAFVCKHEMEPLVRTIRDLTRLTAPPDGPGGGH